MEVLPGEYQKLEIDRSHKIFVRYAERSKVKFGYYLLQINPTMQTNDAIDAIILREGVAFCKFYDIADPKTIPVLLSVLQANVNSSVQIIRDKLKTNKSLRNSKHELAVPFIYLMVFPEISREAVDRSMLHEVVQSLFDESCVFKEEIKKMKEEFVTEICAKLSLSKRRIKGETIEINEETVNAVIQRIAPEYTILRIISNQIENKEYTVGADDELLVVTDDDIAVKAYRLDTEQINIVNKMNKGDQLILACAGSGKSVLLIAKCFKAARMNPQKKFLITCYNRNLRNLYVWFIERAGMQERNVDCLTFEALCKKLLKDAKLPIPNSGTNYHDERIFYALQAMNAGKINNRYYGIFIDEVQIFKQEWYKFCYNLLENKQTQDHIFVICGDKTQNVEKLKKHGKAPWNVGEGYPNFRGGNRSIRIEKNYRNCIEVNEYINRYSEYAKRLLEKHTDQTGEDPDVFLRGKAYRKGIGVEINIGDNYAKNESLSVVKAIRNIHDGLKIPYDEIAIILGQRQYAPKYYYIADKLIEDLNIAAIPYNDMADIDEGPSGHYGEEGVSIVTIRTSLGLDYRAVILCGLMPLGLFERTKKLKDGILKEEQEEDLRRNIRLLYVACSRAKDYLYLQLPDDGSYSVYSKLLIDAFNDPEGISNE